MKSEINFSKQLELNNSLQDRESNKRLLKFFEILIQINNREKLVKNECANYKRDTSNTYKS